MIVIVIVKIIIILRRGPTVLQKIVEISMVQRIRGFLSMLYLTVEDDLYRIILMTLHFLDEIG